ncbi:phenylalanine--tRNA ligase subunit beta [Pikeienuella sp. HZG-20]|uniref:phenylalanine--tRNA ligase subunit beta n=1 Tax=Paludibacillus litoralis TaxID=3133267 RepID=UPI0030ED579D
MKFTLNWLKDHLETKAPLEAILEALTDLGLEVEGVEDPAATLGAFTIARVIEASQHPDADRLRLCRVETWPNGPDAPSEEVQVVCGAPNARTGLIGVFAPPGTHIPGTGLDLKPGVIRGVASNGMLCSEREMMLSDDHDGIIDLPADAPLGARFIDYAGLADPVIEIAVTPNRPDALGVAGIARDLAARGLGRLKTPAAQPVEGGFPCPVAVTIDADALPEAPVFCGRLIRGVVNGPSPAWLQKRLRAIGLRPISTLVDITNFFTYDRNRPLHVFDADKVKGALRVHWAETGSTITALDDKDYTLESSMLAISDEAGPQSIAGIMGGAATGCTPETTNVFVESAYWAPVTIAAAGRKLKINSDARYRFERGVDPAFTPEGLDLATRMIIDLCGGEASEMTTAGAVPDAARSYRLDPARTLNLVGMDVPAVEQVRILEALGFTPVPATQGAGYDVGVPSWRPDVKGEADLVEEVARVVSLSGLEAQPMRPVKPGVQSPVLTPMQKRAAMARRRLAAAGLNECVTYSFVSSREAALFGGGDPLLKLENPISSELSDMRPSPLPGLLAAAARNQARDIPDLGLFEVGAEYFGAEPGEQRDVAAAIRVGGTAPRHWSGARRPVDVYDARADAEAVLDAIGAPTSRLTVTRDAPGWLHPGRSGALTLGPKTTLAVFGELHPKVLSALEVKGPAVAMVVYLENAPFPRAKGRTRPALALSAYQAVERDFAFVVENRVEAATILRAARMAEKNLIESAAVFDVFSGERAEAQMGAGRKSVAITVRLQPTAGTLTDKEIDAVAAKIVSAVTKATGGALRA